MRFDGESDEFRAARWIRPAAFDLGWVPEMKREVYASVLRDFFSVELGGVKLQDEASAPEGLRRSGISLSFLSCRKSAGCW